MKNRFLLAFLLSFLLSWVFAQSPVADFDIPSTACRDQRLNVANLSAHATQFEWDFCLKDAETLSLNEQLAAIPGLTRSYGYKLVQDGEEWFGFATSSNNHSLYRLDFGSSPKNVPVVTNMGNPGGLLQFPEGLDIIKQGEQWFAFIGSLNTSYGIVRLAFGTSLANATPSSQNLGNFGFITRFRAVKAIKNGLDYVLVLVAYNLNSIVRINYRDSFDNTISPENIYNTGTVTNLANPIGIDIVENASDEKIMLVASYNGNSITQLNFGTDILATPAVEATFSLTGISKPYYVKTIQEGEQFYAIVSNETLPVIMLNLRDLDPSKPATVVTHSSLPGAGDVETFRSNGKTYVHVLGGLNNILRQLTFESECDSAIPFLAGSAPPPLEYTTAGDKTIELKAWNDDGEVSFRSKTVSVSAALSPDITFTSTNQCVNHDIFLVSHTASGDISGYAWDFGDLTGSSDPSPVHQYTSANNYIVRLQVVSTNGCTNSFSDTLEIFSQPVASFQMPDVLICTNAAITFPNLTTFDANADIFYQWLVDNNPVSTDRDLQYKFTSVASQEIKLITSIPGCADEMAITTPALAVGPVVDFSFTGTCQDDVFAFQHEITGAVETFLWNFDEDSSSDENPSWEFSSFGDHPVSLTVTNAAGCENIKTREVTVRANPVVDFITTGPPNACAGSASPFQNETTTPDGAELTEWLWDFNDPNDPTPQTVKEPAHTFQSPGTYSVGLTAITADGCVGYAEKNIIIHESPSTAYDHSPACDDVPVRFTPPSDPDIANVYWEIGTSYYEQPTPTHTFRSPGDFPLHLEVTGVNGCVSVLNETIHVPVPLTPDFTVSKNCVNQDAVFTDITTGIDPVVMRTWFLNETETADGPSFGYTFTQEGEQNVTLEVATLAGCIYEVSKQVPVTPPPVASFTSDPTTGAYPLEVTFTNTSTGATHFSWDFPDGSGSTSTETSPVYTFHSEGAFDVVLTAVNEYGCEDIFTDAVSAIAPLPDAEVETITITRNPDGSVKLIITIYNRGNTILNNVPLDIDFSGNLALRLMLSEPVLPGAKHNMIFNTGIVNLDAQRYLCVHLDVANDLTPLGNRACEEFKNHLVVLPPYPNPAESTLHAEWISATGAIVRISLMDAVGRLIFQHETASTAGLNSQTVDLSGLRNGVYYLLVEDSAFQTRQRVVVSH